MLCGFDSAETFDTLSEKMAAAGADISSASMTTDLNLDAAFNTSDGTNTSSMPITLAGSVKMEATVDPAAFKMDGSVEVSALTEGQTLPVQAYTVTGEDGVLRSYMMNPATGSWTEQSSGSLNVSDLMKSAATSAAVGSLSDLGIGFELAPEAADVDGTECYLISTKVDSASMNTLIQKVSEAAGKDLNANADVSAMLSMLNGIVMNLEYYVDASSYLPVRMHVDFNDSDLSAVNQMISATLAAFAGDDAPADTIEIALNDFTMDMDLSYNNVPEIVVPDEVLASLNADSAATAE